MTGEFKNPSKLPLHEVKLSVNQKTIPALSAHWIDTAHTPAYYTPLKLKNGQIPDTFDEDDWLDELRAFNRHLEWILSLEFHRFWSHVVFSKNFLDPLAHFLQESLPFYLPLSRLFPDNQSLVELYTQTCRNALVIACRLITNRESTTEFMAKEKQGQILYDNFIITMPLIFDMCALCGHANKELLEKFVESLVKIEPRYCESDLKAGMKLIVDSFTMLGEQLEKVEDENREKFEKFEDLALYLMNVAVTLAILAEIVPMEVKIFCTRELHVEAAIAGFYDNFVATLYRNSHSVDPTAWFLQLINYSRVELIHAFRTFVNRPIMAIFGANEKNQLKIGDEILSVFSECAGYPTFIADYVKSYPIEMDLDVVTQCNEKKVDKIKLNFVLGAFKSDKPPSSFANNHVQSTKITANDDELSNDDEELEGACALPLKKSEITSRDIEETLQVETAKILELFPELGTGFLRKLLAFYGKSSETVITKIVEDALDSSFANADRSEPYIPPEDSPDAPQQPNSSLMKHLATVYGNDNFDVLKNGKNLTAQQPKNTNELLNDKSHVNSLRERFMQYSLISDAPDDDEREYDDEYDDSYEVFAATEPKIHIRGNMRGELPDSESESSAASEDEGAPKKNPLDFCENPETIRARREQQFQARIAKKFPNRQQKATKDVVGAAKGQGQSDEVLRNRQNKSANKSSRANHNRKTGSAFKQSRGMF